MLVLFNTLRRNELFKDTFKLRGLRGYAVEVSKSVTMLLLSVGAVAPLAACSASTGASLASPASAAPSSMESGQSASPATTRGPAQVPKGGTYEKCWGIAKAGLNDCAAVDASHSCAGQAKADQLPIDWNYIPKGTCVQVGGSIKKPAR